MRPTAWHKNDVSWIDDALKRFGLSEEWESFKIGFVRLDLVIVEQMTLIGRKQHPALSPYHLREPCMRSPYIVMQWRDCAFRTDENSRIDQTHKGRYKCEPVEEVLWHFVIGQQFFMIHEDLPVIAHVIWVRDP